MRVFEYLLIIIGLIMSPFLKLYFTIENKVNYQEYDGYCYGDYGNYKQESSWHQ